MSFPYGPNTPKRQGNHKNWKFSVITTSLLASLILGLIVWSFLNKEKEAEKPSEIKYKSTIKTVTAVKSKIEKPPQISSRTNRIYKMSDGRPSIPLRKMTLDERREWLNQARIDNAIACGRTNELGEAIIHKSPFKNSTQEILAQIFTWELGKEPPPMMPRIPFADRQNLALIMMDMSSDQEGDSEQLKEARKAVRESLDMMKEYVKSGGRPDEFIDYYIGELKHYSNMRQDAQRTFREMLRTENDPVTLKAYFDAINDTLKEKGITPLKANKNVKALMGQ